MKDKCHTRSCNEKGSAWFNMKIYCQRCFNRLRWGNTDKYWDLGRIK